jgi:Spy/CpxP family protein refolding chaperone
MKASMAASLGLAIAGLFLAGAAGAQAPAGGSGFGGHRPPMERAFGPQGKAGRWWNNPATIEKLKLTDAQRKQMDEILQKHRETLVDLRGNLEKAELVMEPLMRDDQPNEAKILGQIDKVAQARAELEKANARFLLGLRSKLTPEQWKWLYLLFLLLRVHWAWPEKAPRWVTLKARIQELEPLNNRVS